MRLYQQFSNIIDGQFAENEVVIESLIIHCSLYYIMSNGKIYFHNRIIDVDIDGDIASLCFVRNNHIFLICTSERYRGMGYARTLLSNVLNIIKKAKLNVRVSNTTAIGLYISLGFQQSRIKRNYYNYTSVNEDAIEMVYDSTDFFSDFFVIPDI